MNKIVVSLLVALVLPISTRAESSSASAQVQATAEVFEESAAIVSVTPYVCSGLSASTGICDLETAAVIRFVAATAWAVSISDDGFTCADFGKIGVTLTPNVGSGPLCLPLAESRSSGTGAASAQEVSVQASGNVPVFGNPIRPGVYNGSFTVTVTAF